MMKQLLFFGCLTFILSAYTHFGSNGCPTKSLDQMNGNVRHLTCSSCHAATNFDVVISDGRVVDEEEGIIAFDVMLPLSIREGMVLDMYINDSRENAFGTATTGPIRKVDGLGAQLSFDLSLEKSSKNESNNEPITLFWEAPKEFIVDQYIQVQGVISNLDGTNEGDYAFEKTVLVSPSIFAPTIQELTLYPTLANTTITVEGFEQETTLIRIINILGTTVYEASVAQFATLKVDVTQFENGNYFMVVNPGKDQETKRFVVQK